MIVTTVALHWQAGAVFTAAVMTLLLLTWLLYGDRAVTRAAVILGLAECAAGIATADLVAIAGGAVTAAIWAPDLWRDLRGKR